MTKYTGTYQHEKIEKKWQSIWEQNKTFSAKDNSDKPKYYILDMFPYPSGAGLHIGHPEGYTASDILGRFKLANGFNVLHPMGWDAFGLPAEQYAVKTGTHPSITTKNNIENFKRQIKSIGFALDWDREISTTDVEYFKWTQWIFLRLFKMGLAYIDEKPVWWCEKLATVLANEEVIDSKSEVGGFPVERKKLRQWVLKITAYADRLIEDLKDVDWPVSTKKLQENWIGKSTGAKINFKIDSLDDSLEVYTTRPDTIFGATYMVVSPEHPLIYKLTTSQNKQAVEDYKKICASKSDLDRTDLAKDKTGVFTGSYAINPINGKKIPIWTADYVLMSYGTGAIMAVPAHDERDFEFAQKFNLEIIRVIENVKGEKEPKLPFITQNDTIMVNSGKFTGMASKQAKEEIIKFLEENKIGKPSKNYKLRDWLFSRQRYWGEPFPIVWVEKDAYDKLSGEVLLNMPKEPIFYTENGKTFYAVALPDTQLPLCLPKMDSYKPAGDGKSPLANNKDWVNVWFNVNTGQTVSSAEQKPQGDDWFASQRETNTMPQWAGSCWYYLRYIDPKNANEPISKEKEAYWGTPDFYIGGAEHAVLHLLYARFWHKVLFDNGIVSNKEPFKKLFHQGIILGQMEFTAFKNENGDFVSLPENTQEYEAVKISPDDVIKQGKDYVLKDDKNIAVLGRSFKMSKSRGNVVNPDEIIDQYGADCLRMYEMFLGPLEDMKPWNSTGIEGMSRFLKKLYGLVLDNQGNVSEKIKDGIKDDDDLQSLLHVSIKKITSDIENLRLNTAISQLMILLNLMQKKEAISKNSVLSFIGLLAPFAPHICEELWERLGQTGSVTMAKWPSFDEKLTQTSSVKIAIQVSGKVRADISIEKNWDKDKVLTLAKENEKVKPWLDGKTIVKEIYVPSKIINIVVK